MDTLIPLLLDTLPLEDIPPSHLALDPQLLGLQIKAQCAS